MILIASNEDEDERIEVAVQSDGSFAFLQFSDDLMKRQYQGQTLIAEDLAHPAHFNYYDGQRTMISAAPFASLKMYESHTLPKPLAPGESIQSKWCIWPLLDTLSHDWSMTEQTDEITVAQISSVNLTLTFDTSDRLTEILWAPPAHAKAAISASWVYSDFQPVAQYTLPARLEYTLKSTDAQGDPYLDQANTYTLTYDLDPEQIQTALTFSGADTMQRRDSKSGDVINPDGSLAYNEKGLGKYAVPVEGTQQRGRRPNYWFRFALAATAITTILLAVQRLKA